MERISRIIEHWTLPTADQILDHVRRAQIQIVQVGNFGLDFYSVAEDAEIARSWAGMPLHGIRANLALAAEVIPQIQAAGARVVGQLSTTMHFGDHEKRLGLFGDAWGAMWADEVLGAAPCLGIEQASQRQADGSLVWRTIAGRPYRTYRGCMCNPHWGEILRAMVRKGLEVGLDGFNATHHYESFCRCSYCCDWACSYLSPRLSRAECAQLYGRDQLDTIDPFAPLAVCPEPLRQRLELMLAQGAGLRRKESFDEVFATYGRSLKTGLLLAQWNHKYDFRPHDERSLLPAELWAKGEDYIWYSQGPNKWGSDLARGYLADMGLPSRFIYAAGQGRPFVINKYDYRRWRIWAGEAMAHHGAAIAFHAGPPRLEQEEMGRVAPEDYYGPVIRYQRFMAEHEALLHPATPYSQVALVYPRRAEMQAEMDCLDGLKRLGHLLEDDHWLFDIILDEQLLERANTYPALILPGIARLSEEEGQHIRAYVEAGGTLVYTGATGCSNEDGVPYERSLLRALQPDGPPGAIGGHKAWGRGRVLYLADGPWQPERVALGGTIGAEMPTFPMLEVDSFGKNFLRELSNCVGPAWLSVDAPPYVRVRAWWVESGHALVIHWINYMQDEAAAIEVPIPVGPFTVQCRLPDGSIAERVEWRYPEMRAPQEVDFAMRGQRVSFTLERLIAYGMSIVYLR